MSIQPFLCYNLILQPIVQIIFPQQFKLRLREMK